jgi:hypothetical protein
MNVTVPTHVEGREEIESYLRAHPTTNVTFEYVTAPTRLFKPCAGMHYALRQWFAVGLKFCTVS